jgi:methyl coenzyme M reductase alpha subunit
MAVNWKQLLANYINPPDNFPDDRLEMIKIRIDQRTYKTRGGHEIAMSASGEELSRWQGMQRVQDSVAKK